MYLIITGKKPFEGRDEKTLQYLIENNEVDFDQGNIKLLS